MCSHFLIPEMAPVGQLLLIGNGSPIFTLLRGGLVSQGWNILQCTSHNYDTNSLYRCNNAGTIILLCNPVSFLPLNAYQLCFCVCHEGFPHSLLLNYQLPSIVISGWVSIQAVDTVAFHKQRVPDL